MSRSIGALVALLLAAAVLAAPAPQLFKAGWDKPLDPDNDCKFIRDKDSLTIELPGTYHDFDTWRDRFNAPRLLRDLEGDFVMQVRIRIECRPSAGSTAEGQPPSVSGGFLILPPDKSCIRLEYGVPRHGRKTESYAVLKDRPGGHLHTDYVWDGRYKNWPMPEKAEQAYLRLERRGTKFFPSLSPDGEKWTLLVGHMGIVGLPAKLKVGLAAYSTSAEPSKVRFDQFKLTQGQKKR